MTREQELQPRTRDFKRYGDMGVIRSKFTPRVSTKSTWPCGWLNFWSWKWIFMMPFGRIFLEAPGNC